MVGQQRQTHHKYCGDGRSVPSGGWLPGRNCDDGDPPFNKPYQDLWFYFLDTGSKAPGFAETDFFLNNAAAKTKQETFLNHMHLGNRAVTEQNIRDVASRGELFASNGAFLTASVDGIPMGSVCRTADGRHHRLRIEAYPEPGSSFSRIEVIGKPARFSR